MTGNALPRPLTTPQAPSALGPYAQAQIVSNGETEWLYLSGQIGAEPASGNLVTGGTAGQAAQVMLNLRSVLGAAGFAFADVVKTTIFLVDLTDFETVNEIYGRALGEARPARSTVEVAYLPKSARIEIDMVAVQATGR